MDIMKILKNATWDIPEKNEYMTAEKFAEEVRQREWLASQGRLSISGRAILHMDKIYLESLQKKGQSDASA